MGETFSLGRLFGVRVGVNWSVLVIFALLALLLAQGRLPAVYPDRPLWQYWTVGLIAAAVFLASLLAHELSHAVVARRNGVETDSIVLWLLGGAARLRSDAPSPGAELRIAGIGPLVSLLIGLFFAAVASVVVATAGPGLGAEAVAWLAAINILLALFNALPAAPLDGGRLLRAVVWWRTGDWLRATTVASGAGRGLGWLLIGLGVYLFLLGGIVGGLWFALIGWFLIAVATMESDQARMRFLLGDVPVRRVMTPDPVAVPAGLSVAEFLERDLFRYRHSAFPVTGPGGEPLGLLTLDRIRDVPEPERGRVTLGDAMLPLAETATTSPGTPLTELLARLESSPGRRALVLEDGRLVGIVSASDVSRVISWMVSTRPRPSR